MRKAIAHFDGRGNCEDGSCATVIDCEGISYSASCFLGSVSNNYAEYSGLILTLRQAKLLGITHLQIFSDSKLVVHQVRGEWRIRQDSLRSLRDLAWSEGQGFQSLDIKWVSRSENTVADKLCRDCSKIHAHA